VDSQNIRHDQDLFIIQGDYSRDELEEKIHCGVQKNKRKHFRRNKKEYDRLSDHIGLLPVVMISPADSSLIIEGSEERRKFMNAVIAQYDSDYLESLVRYNRALTQRNVLLKSFAKKGMYQPDMLDVWDRQLLQNGPYIHRKRKDFIGELVPIFQDYYERVSSGREQIGLQYQSQLNDHTLEELLRDHEGKDRILQYTTAGTHKDDLQMSLEGHPIKRIGSQGQQKTFLVALKLAKFEFIRNVNGFHPILLLDDVFDKFDAKRVEQIIKLVADQNFGQIFITDTNRERIGKILNQLTIEYKLFHVDDGRVSEIK
jgi:DNA replication and repair protein RecF